VRRGLANMQIQAYLTAAAIHLKRLATVILSILAALWPRPEPRSNRAQHRSDPIQIRLVRLAELASI
jgi:hypothetical protein